MSCSRGGGGRVVVVGVGGGICINIMSNSHSSSVHCTAAAADIYLQVVRTGGIFDTKAL